MQTVTTVGLDIAKSVFQVPCVDAAGQAVRPRSGPKAIHFADQQIAPAADCEVAREQYRMAWGGYGCRGTGVDHVV